MSLPSSLVYDNGIMSLSFMNRILSLSAFPIFFCLLLHRTMSAISQLVQAQVNMGGMGVCADDVSAKLKNK